MTFKRKEPIISVAGYLSGVILLSVGDVYLKSMRVLRFIESARRLVYLFLSTSSSGVGRTRPEDGEWVLVVDGYCSSGDGARVDE